MTEDNPPPPKEKRYESKKAKRVALLREQMRRMRHDIKKKNTMEKISRISSWHEGKTAKRQKLLDAARASNDAIHSVALPEKKKREVDGLGDSCGPAPNRRRRVKKRLVATVEVPCIEVAATRWNVPTKVAKIIAAVFEYHKWYSTVDDFLVEACMKEISERRAYAQGDVNECQVREWIESIVPPAQVSARCMTAWRKAWRNGKLGEAQIIWGGTTLDVRETDCDVCDTWW